MFPTNSILFSPSFAVRDPFSLGLNSQALLPRQPWHDWVLRTLIPGGSISLLHRQAALPDTKELSSLWDRAWQPLCSCHLLHPVGVLPVGVFPPGWAMFVESRKLFPKGTRIRPCRNYRPIRYFTSWPAIGSSGGGFVRLGLFRFRHHISLSTSVPYDDPCT